MAGIGSLVSQSMARLREIPELLFVSVWNNQYDQSEDGKTWAFPWPNAFVELINPQQWTQLGQGYQQGDIDVKIHIGADYYNNPDGYQEQNMDIFTLRDKVVAKFTLWKPDGGGHMFKVEEQQDYEHSNIYGYEVVFRCGFIDTVGSIPETGSFVTKDPPIEIVVEKQVPLWPPV